MQETFFRGMKVKDWLYSHTRSQLMVLTKGKTKMMKKINDSISDKPESGKIKRTVQQRHGSKMDEETYGKGMTLGSLIRAGLPIEVT